MVASKAWRRMAARLSGVPGGSIEPLYNALARSERQGGIRAIVARHEAGAAFMASFGLGTLPMMLAFSLAGPRVQFALRGRLQRALPLVSVTAAVLL